MRVLAVTDVYEALTADRPYRPAYSSEGALGIMRNEVPRRLDRDAFAALETLLENRGAGAWLGDTGQRRPSAAFRTGSERHLRVLRARRR